MDFLLSNNNFLILIVAVVSGIMLLLPAFTKKKVGRPLSASEVVQQMNQNQAILLDIRPKDQFKTGHIPQARNITLNDLATESNNLPKDKPIIVVCQHGRTATKGVASLRKLGFTQVYSLENGQQAWVEAGLPVKKS